MRWIETNDGGLVNLEQVCGVYIAESMFDGEPEEYSVVYLFTAKVLWTNILSQNRGRRTSEISD